MTPERSKIVGACISMQPAMRSDSEELSKRAGFAKLVADVEPSLRRALIATYGPERGREATAEALAWAWEHRLELAGVTNPIAFLYRVGQSRSRRRRIRPVFERPATEEPWVEPQLAAALAALPMRQRISVFLVHGAGWTQAEVAELLQVRLSTVQTHVERAMAKLRHQIGVERER
jgi:RNA polymerase sigma factor (sigma-70 family)